MNVSIQLETSEVVGLERIAEGRASTVPDHVADRLLAKGLVQQMDVRADSQAGLALTPKGLSFIRSSDQ